MTNPRRENFGIRAGQSEWVWSGHGWWQMLPTEPVAHEPPELTPEKRMRAAMAYMQARYAETLGRAVLAGIVPPSWTSELDHGTAKRSLITGHRIADWDPQARLWVAPIQTRYVPRRWLTEYYRRYKARQLGHKRDSGA